MELRVWLICTVIATLCSACSNRQGEDDTYIGWHCTGDLRKDDWRCNKRRMRNGIPVDDVIYEVRKGTGVDAGEAKAADDDSMVLLPPRNGEWKNQLPTLNVDEPGVPDTPVTGTAKVPDPGKPAAKDKPPPEPEPAFDSWAEPEAAESTELAMVDEADGEEPTARELPPMAAVDEGDSNARYTVQLGAFANFRGIREFITENNLEGAALERHRIASNGRIWHVVTFGAFPTREAAEQAWEEYAIDRPDVEIWVRTIRSLLEARAAAEE